MPGMQLDWLTPRKKKTLSHAYDELELAIARHKFDNLILSSEGFGSPRVTMAHVEWLKAKMREYEVKIIAYIRPQDSYLISTYQEEIKAGSTAQFEFTKHINSPLLRFSRRLAPWRETFGAENVIVRPFVPALWHGGDLFSDFLRILEIRDQDFERATIANEGMDYRAVELLRRFNSLEFESPHARRKCVELCLNLSDYLPKGFKKQKMRLSSEQAEEMRLFYNADNEIALAGSGISTNEFFPEVTHGTPLIESNGQIDVDLLIQLTAALQCKMKI